MADKTKHLASDDTTVSVHINQYELSMIYFNWE